MTRAILTSGLVLLYHFALIAEPIEVRRMEGIVHGFLILRTLDGKPLADGDLVQVPSGGRVSSRLSFRFKDGSIHEESAVYTQRRYFRLLSSRLVQKGPTFPRTLDIGEESHLRRRANDGVRGRGNAETSRGEARDLFGRPRAILDRRHVARSDALRREGQHRGRRGLLAPLVGKQPPDSHVWVLGGEAPAFVKAELPLYLGAPLWRIELMSPVWPHSARRTHESPTHVREPFADHWTVIVPCSDSTMSRLWS